MSEDPTKGEIKLRCEWGGETWEFIPWRDLTGRDWLAMERHRPDLSKAMVVNAMITSQVTVLALCLWAYVRRDEKKLTYEQVLDEVTAESFTIVMPPAEDDDPGEVASDEDEGEEKGSGAMEERPS